MTRPKRTIYNPKLYPPSLERAVLRVVSYHVGRPNSIPGANLVRAVSILGFRTDERQVREAVKQLRRAGFLIGSAAGKGGGYYMLTSRQEFDDFVTVEFHAQIADMSETLRVMQFAAAREWGRPKPGQFPLF